ncbi:Procollagen-proline 4-dioxygenase [Forsythia ovata]|uniref:procollagen-proline 4-dioxygenase n=1 Tax=Forsythia ovata TaxID=205694 RepID=A0ABD1UEJ7_9LAMI
MVYMESVTDDIFAVGDGYFQVAFTVVLGFKVGQIVVQSQNVGHGGLFCPCGLYQKRISVEIDNGCPSVSLDPTRVSHISWSPREWFRYEHGQKYELHFDYFDDEANQQLGGHLVATVLMYSLNIEKGGETVFPSSEARERQQKSDDWSDCAKNGYEGKLDFVRNGPQQSGYTVHVSLFDIPSKSSSRDCIDKDPHCPAWGLHGECERNPQYMVGSEDDLGYFRKSCKVCSS